MDLRDVLEWKFQTLERRALRDGKRTSKMKVVKSKRNFGCMAILLRTPVLVTTHIRKRYSRGVYSGNILDPFWILDLGVQRGIKYS